MTGRIIVAAIVAVFGWAVLSAVAEAVWDATRGMRKERS